MPLGILLVKSLVGFKIKMVEIYNLLRQLLHLECPWRRGKQEGPPWCRTSEGCSKGCRGCTEFAGCSMEGGVDYLVVAWGAPATGDHPAPRPCMGDRRSDSSCIHTETCKSNFNKKK